MTFGTLYVILVFNQQLEIEPYGFMLRFSSIYPIFSFFSQDDFWDLMDQVWYIA